VCVCVCVCACVRVCVCACVCVCPKSFLTLVKAILTFGEGAFKIMWRVPCVQS